MCVPSKFDQFRYKVREGGTVFAFFLIEKIVLRSCFLLCSSDICIHVINKVVKKTKTKCAHETHVRK